MLRGVASFSFFCTVAVGCTSLLGDFAVSGGPIDAGSPTDAAGVPVDAGLAWAIVQASTSDVSVFVGQAAVVDASNSSTTQGTLTFSWAVVLAPAGSGVTTSNLAGATSAKATFVPDLNGEYDLQVTVTALGVSDTRTAKVSAASPQVLFAQGIAPGADKGSATYVVTDSDGGSHAVLCPDVISNSSVPIGAFAAYTGRAYDFWEAPPGQPLKFAAFTLDAIPDAGLFAHLWSGTSASTCDAGPIDYATTSFGPGRPWGSDPHFSPDGSRFVVFDRDWNIVTFAADAADGGGETSHVVATYPVPYKQAPAYFDPVAAGPDAGYPFEPPRVAWTDNGLAWAQPTSSGWEIVEAADMQDATPTRYMTCKGVTPREIAMLRDGTVIVSYRPTLDSSENIHLLKPDAQQNCYHEQQYTNLLDSGTSVATDFAVSPDETQIAFLEMDTTSQDASLWTTPGGDPRCPAATYTSFRSQAGRRCSSRATRRSTAHAGSAAGRRWSSRGSTAWPPLPVDPRLPWSSSGWTVGPRASSRRATESHRSLRRRGTPLAACRRAAQGAQRARDGARGCGSWSRGRDGREGAGDCGQGRPAPRQTCPCEPYRVCHGRGRSPGFSAFHALHSGTELAKPASA